ncbi:hypothetical protein [Staphylococcus pseudintermedius]|nr:hypothetical protein [Staphylococcus pseudintermedius]
MKNLDEYNHPFGGFSEFISHEKENGIYNYNNYIHILFIIGIHTISILYI